MNIRPNKIFEKKNHKFWEKFWKFSKKWQQKWWNTKFKKNADLSRPARRAPPVSPLVAAKISVGGIVSPVWHARRICGNNCRKLIKVIKNPSLIGWAQQMDNSFLYDESYRNDSTYENESSICWTQPIRDWRLKKLKK